MDTIEELIETMKGWIHSTVPIAPSRWTEICLSLNLLKDKEYRTLHSLQQKTAQMKVGFIQAGDSVAAAKAKVEASEEYRKCKDQESYLEMIDEQIRIAKAHGKLRNDESKGY